MKQFDLKPKCIVFNVKNFATKFLVSLFYFIMTSTDNVQHNKQ